MLRHRPALVLAALAVATGAAISTPSSGLAERTTPPVPVATESVPTVSTIPTLDPFGVDPIDGGTPIGDPSDEIVQRWTITPQGANDPNAISTRAELAYTGEPGAVIEDGVTVFNLGNDVLNFRIYATDAANDPSGAFTLLAGDVAPTDVGTWVTVAQENVTLAPGMAATIPITIAIPDDASPGDHTGGVVAASATIGTTDDGSILNVDRSVGTRLYLRVAGPIRPELAVEQLATSYDGSINPLDGSTRVTFRIQNRGNVRLAGTHQVTVAGPFGLGRARSEQVEFPELLPGQGIDVSTDLTGIPALGWVSTDVDVSPTGGDSVAAGVAASSTRSFAVPVPIVLLLILILLTWFARRRYRRHRDVDSDHLPSFELDREPVAVES